MRVFTAAGCLAHDPGAGHPDQPARLAAVVAALAAAPGIELAEAAAAPVDALYSSHDPAYLEQAAALSRAGGGELGPDTTLNGASWDAALAATGAAIGALESAVRTGRNAFAAIRPPGHHALRDRAMGFCIINHVAVVAAMARHLERDRVLIVDWDVHHGNGTQAMFEREPQIRFVSMHQWPWYPGTGRSDERGVGNCFNLPMPAGLDPVVYLESLWRGIEQATAAWRPDVVLISAGYDAMRGDPLGGFTLEPEHFATWVFRMRERWPSLPIIGLLEGGYVPQRLAAGVLATVRALA